MNSITQHLRAEHERVRLAVTCLDRLAEEVLAGAPLARKDTLDVLRYLDLAVNRMHQDKEERVLFPALLRTNQLADRICGLICDHDAERTVLAKLQRTLAGAYGERGSRYFALLAQEYCRAQSEHADVEETVLLPIADELLEPCEQRRLCARALAIEFEYGVEELEAVWNGLEAVAARLQLELPRA
jgi:hemerythrin-like domain-containing protein